MSGEAYLHFERAASRTPSAIPLIPRLAAEDDYSLAGSEK